MGSYVIVKQAMFRGAWEVLDVIVGFDTEEEAMPVAKALSVRDRHGDGTVENPITKYSIRLALDVTAMGRIGK